MTRKIGLSKTWLVGIVFWLIPPCTVGESGPLSAPLAASPDDPGKSEASQPRPLLGSAPRRSARPRPGGGAPGQRPALGQRLGPLPEFGHVGRHNGAPPLRLRPGSYLLRFRRREVQGVGERR